jgi:putative nucleotidyltransferase with HDIG domain
MQLIELSRQESVQPGAMVALLERDPMLAAELLRLAQSSLYGGSFSVRTLDEAIVRLGMRRTAELFLHAALEARVFRAAGYQKKMDELRRHSVVVAHLSRLVGREAGVTDQSAFICGLLHDVGIAASMIAVVETCPSGQTVPSFDEIWPTVQEVHGRAGGVLASAWNFPSEVTFVIERHHEFMVAGELHPLAAVVCLADWAANELGVGFATEQDRNDGGAVLDALGLGPTQAQVLLEKASKVLERVT